MKKIILKNCDVKEFCSLIKRSASLDNFIFINLVGSEFESTAYNRTHSALKSISANLEEYCDGFTNECGDDLTKIQFTNASKFISVLNLMGTDSVDITFFIDDDSYAKKVIVNDLEVKITVPAADKEALSFLEIPSHVRHSIFEDLSTLQYKVGITDSEFKYLTQLFNLNKEACRVFFSITGDTVTVSEIESIDDNVRTEVNEILDDVDIEKFDAYEKLYSKKMNVDSFETNADATGYLHCFNKSYFTWIDADKHYDIEFHSNKVKFVSVDDKGTKTYVVLTPVPFA